MTPQTEAVKRTRADVLRDRVKIRLALDEAAPDIAKILRANGIEIPGQWTVFPNWLIAAVGEEVIGCVQVLPGKPVAYLNFLHTKPSTSFKLRVIALRKLVMLGMATVRDAGASFVFAHVPGRMLDVTKRLDFVEIAPDVPIMKRLK